jgi:hypothetical protein
MDRIKPKIMKHLNLIGFIATTFLLVAPLFGKAQEFKVSERPYDLEIESISYSWIIQAEDGSRMNYYVKDSSIEIEGDTLAVMRTLFHYLMKCESSKSNTDISIKSWLSQAILPKSNYSFRKP